MHAEMSNLKSLKPLQRAIAIAGGQRALAREIGKTQGHISKWLERRYLPAEVVLKIEQATGVPRHDLRPDLYPQSKKIKS